MKMSGGPASFNIKITLLVLALAIALSTLYYTQTLVQKLQVRERQGVELYAESLEYVANSEAINTDYTFIFENVIQRIDFPLILTDENDNVIRQGVGGGVRNLPIDTTLSEEEIEIYLKETMEELRKVHDPILIHYDGESVGGKIYYGDSDLVRKLRYYPFIQILFAFFFVTIAYFSFSYMKKNEQSNIWIGMAKETAHQLGTPISSILGWSEMLKLNFNNPLKVKEFTEEIGSDLERLNKITHRFSKIGSKPELKSEIVSDVIEKVIIYFQKRLPQSNKNVSIELIGDKKVKAELNAELFEWVVENLIKNSLDSIGNKKGKVIFNIDTQEKTVEIDVTDNGKGIDLKRRSDIFRPGYSTKRRGWGLGLTLSKRIVENYHKGKIFVRHSVINEGTTIRISISKSV
ncbi:PAS domain-containing sensor histidine kinase [Bacteroidota bacterium]